MGLFIGASILTILELFDYIYEVRRDCPQGSDPALHPPAGSEPWHKEAPCPPTPPRACSSCTLSTHIFHCPILDMGGGVLGEVLARGVLKRGAVREMEATVLSLGSWKSDGLSTCRAGAGRVGRRGQPCPPLTARLVAVASYQGCIHIHIRSHTPHTTTEHITLTRITHTTLKHNTHTTHIHTCTHV